MTGSISVEEISKHNSLKDLWTVVNGGVYDLTDFAPEHPGGVESVYIPLLLFEMKTNSYTLRSHPSLCRPRRNGLLFRIPRSLFDRNLSPAIQTPWDS